MNLIYRCFIVGAFISLFAVSAHATGFGSLDFSGPSTFQASGTTVHITVTGIVNNSSTYTSGSLRLDLWAFTSPYAGGAYSGYKTASIRTSQLTGLTDQLGPSRSFSNITMDLTYTAPASGYSSYSLFLMEFSNSCTTSDHFCVTAYLNYSSNHTVTGTVVDRSGNRISEATITLTGNEKTFTTSTDGSGGFSLTFSKTGIPSTLAFTVVKTGYVPVAVPLTLSSGSTTSAGTVTMDVQGEEALAVEVVPELHHLGDNDFSGSINSQFQKTAEGRTYTRTFTLSSGQLSAASATLSMLAKGVDGDCNDPVRINNNFITYLAVSPSSGAYGTQTMNVATRYFIAGTNTLTITSGFCDDNYDDFEFTNAVIRFSGLNSNPVTVPNLQFSVANRGGVSTVSPGSGNSVTVGYGKIQPSSGSTTPSGVAVFGLRQNGVLVSEAGVPATPAIQSGRIYAEVGGAVNTGLAMANPNSQSATVSFYFTDSSGNFGSSSTTIPANGQIAAFLDQSPFNGRSSLAGTFTFSSSVPIAVVALRGLTNEQSQFLLTTLPVTDLSVSTGTGTVAFPHFAEGGGWTTQVILVNPSDNVISGTIQFRDQSGLPTSLTANGQASNSFSYSIAARSSHKLQTSGSATSTSVGSVRVIPLSGAAPSGLAIFSYRRSGVTVSEAGVPAVPAGTAFRVYAEGSGTLGAIGSIQTGLAITNTSSGATTVTVEITRLDGSSLGLTGSLSIAANGQTATFLNQIPGLSSLPATFQGVLRISSSAAIAVVGLRGRYNERGDFLITTTTPVNELSTASSSPAYFPHLADGGGYTTQFILFGGLSGQTSSGSLTLVSQSGTGLALTLQ